MATVISLVGVAGPPARIARETLSCRFGRVATRRPCGGGVRGAKGGPVTVGTCVGWNGGDAKLGVHDQGLLTQPCRGYRMTTESGVRIVQ